MTTEEQHMNEEESGRSFAFYYFRRALDRAIAAENPFIGFVNTEQSCESSITQIEEKRNNKNDDPTDTDPVHP
jgi:hypothetical protein